MADDSKGLVAAGASLVWRRQRVLWWVFAVNFILSALGTAATRNQLQQVLGQSLAGQPLTKGFDLGMFFELVRVPESNLFASHGASLHMGILFFLFMVFVTGGILTVYREDRKLKTGEFFGASGAFFWRFVRLALFSLIPFAVLGLALWGVNKLSNYIGDRTVSAQTGFYIFLAGAIVVILLALFVRLWFDIAQVRAVVQDEHKMWPNLWKALGISWRNVATLFRVYLCISGVAWVTLAVGLFVWAKLPPTAAPVTFLLLEFIILMQLLTRLWQRASSVTWYRRHAAMVLVDAADYTTPALVELVEPIAEMPATAKKTDGTAEERSDSQDARLAD
ncbi:MAG TPA: hypothetical protein VII23_17575 [Terriglobales bacterium]